MTTAVKSPILTSLATSAGSALVEPVLSAIMHAVPEPLPGLGLGPTPEFASAVPLAEVVGADPSRLLNAAQNLAADRDAILDTLRDSAPKIASAATDIILIGQRFVGQAQPLIPQLFAGPAGVAAAAELAALAAAALWDVNSRLDQLERDLDPLVRRLDSLVAAALGREPLVPSTSAEAASGDLRSTSTTVTAEQKKVEVPDGPAGMSSTVPASHSSSGGSAAGQAAVDAAKSMVGTPYVWGGSAPGGFDCSGLTSWAYGQAGVEIPRTAENQAVGQQVQYEDLQPGDLVVWSGHVAMYAGDGMMVEAGDPVQMNPVRTSNIGMPFMGFWRPTA